ncbi:tRNA (guanosine(37)-N1)-methyltransferase TrmD [Desulfococcaceae bacterium HSG7]|nr:tRNA (guanosine(37)-N1)-methyltransferase TrmD [Desulfococcaceae bacterium HSG7]
MNFRVLTIFPDMFDLFWKHGIVRRAVERGMIKVSAMNIRDYAQGRHSMTDDRPFGGGSGMIMKAEPLAKAIRSARLEMQDARTILLSPQGECFNQHKAHALADSKGLIFICGRYEGVDERIYCNYVDEEISIGDFILTGGELAAMVIIDAVVRLLPGVLGDPDSAVNESFNDNLLEHAHYTRPRTFEGIDVPPVLISGNHKEINKWRAETTLIRTFLKRPDMLADRPLSDNEREILKNWRQELNVLIQG